MSKSKKMKKAMLKLSREYNEITNNPSIYYSISRNTLDPLKWNFLLFGQPNTIFYGGIFKGIINFPVEYPNKPPVVKFEGDQDIPILYHPNIYKDGKVCISILHEGADAYNYESAQERWLPQHGVNSILVSISFMLTEPNFDSPANLDAKKEWVDDYDKYKNRIFKIVALTLKK